MHTVNTKVDIRFHVQRADWLSQEVRDKLIHLVGSSVGNCITVLWFVSAGDSLDVQPSATMSRGGGTPILKLYGDVLPFRVWFFGPSAHKQGLKLKDFRRFFINRV